MVYSRLNEALDLQSQTENYKYPGVEYPNDSESEDKKIQKSFTIPAFMPQILPDNEITEGIDSLNSK